MNVCLVSGEYPPMQGGVGDFTRELARALIGLGTEVNVVTSTAAGPTSSPHPPFPSPKIGRGEGGMGGRGEGGWGEAQVYPIVDHWGWRSQARILKLARQATTDVINIQYQAAAYALHPAINLLPLRRRLAGPGLPVVVTFHDLKVPYLFPKAGRLRYEVVLLLARTADAVIVTNEEDWARLEHVVPPSKLHLIPIGSNIDPQPPPGYDRSVWRARLGIPPDQTVLAYFGFLNATKGGEDLIRALDRLIQQGVNTRLMMIGGRVGASDPTNLAYLRRVEALIAELGLENRVSWTDHLPAPEVSAHLLAADVAVLPYRDGASYRRGTLMAVLAHGLPVVTTTPTSKGWAARLPPLVDGENVRLVPAENSETLAAAIAGLAADPDLRQHLSTGAAQLAQAFGWESIARQTLNVYQRTRYAKL